MTAAAAELLPPAPASDSPLFAPAEEQVIGEPRHCSVAFKNAGKTTLEPRWRFTELEWLTSHNVKSLEKASDFIRGAKGNWSKWKDHFRCLPRLRSLQGELPVGKGLRLRVVFRGGSTSDSVPWHSPSGIDKQITSINMEPGVEIELTIADA